MRVLGISGSLRRDSHNTQAAEGGRRARRGARRRVRALRRAQAIPPYDEDDDVGDGPPPVAAPARRDRWRRRGAVLDARVQLLDPRRAEERRRLGLAALATNALRNKPVAVVGAEHRDVRRRLGTGGAAQGARLGRRPRGGGRARRRSRPRAPRPRRPSSDPAQAEPCATRWASCSARSHSWRRRDADRHRQLRGRVRRHQPRGQRRRIACAT